MRIPNSSVSVPPPVCEVGVEKVYAYSRRKPGDGRICLVEFRAGDHRLLVTYDASVLPNFGDTALATPILSSFSGTLKAVVSYIPEWGGNDRLIEVIDTGYAPEVSAVSAPQMKMKHGEPTAKWKASAQAGGVAAAVVTILGFAVAQLLPSAPSEVQAAIVIVLVALLSSAATGIPMLVAAWLKRPSPRDTIVEDPAASRTGIPEEGQP